MANKPKKKRNKQYTGADAAMTRSSVTRITAANRSPIKQWWFEKKRIVKPVAIATAILIAVVWLIFEVVRIANQ